MSNECNTRKRRILAFESWDEGSHAAVREQLELHGAHDWNWITLPRGHWRWRLRLGAPELIDQAQQRGVFNESWDMVFATSLMSLSDLVALMPASCAELPRILYMHENQAAYPSSAGTGDSRDGHAISTNLTSMLAADLVIWNSQWNQDSFLRAVRQMLKANVRHGLNELPKLIEAKSLIRWPPVPDITKDLHPIPEEVLHNANLARDRGLTLVVWPHRWEHDKGPGELLHLEETYGESHQLGWILLGQQFAQIPQEFEAFKEHAGDRLLQAGWVERDVYLGWLQVAEWVCSTAVHEYFGIAVVEAMLAGCLPWLPERLSYPELLPSMARGLSPMNPPEAPEEILAAIRARLSPAIGRSAAKALEDAMDQAAPLARR